MKRALVVVCSALMLTFTACGGDGGDGGGGQNTGGETDNDNDPGPDDPNPDSDQVCDSCAVDTLSSSFGECLNACRADCPEQFSECRDACLDECDGCGTGLSCLYGGDEVGDFRCGPSRQVTTCDGVMYGDGL